MTDIKDPYENALQKFIENHEVDPWQREFADEIFEQGWVAGINHACDQFDAVLQEFGEKTMNGRGAAKGTIEGIARVLVNPTDPIEDGEILVTRTTNVNWTPLFDRIGGVITEIGGILCHAAVVAREMGIPAIVSAKGATESLDGKKIRMDGTTGQVEILD